MDKTSHSKWFTQPEMLVGLSAVLVSLVALVVGVYSAYVDREFARASVWPSLLLAQSYNSERFSYLLLNQGTGPAIIKYARLESNGKVFKVWADWLEDEGFANAPFSQSHIGGGVVRAGQQVVAFSTEDMGLKAHLSEGAQNSLKVCYCSVFDDCWVVDGFDAQTEVDACSISDDERFTQ